MKIVIDHSYIIDAMDVTLTLNCVMCNHKINPVAGFVVCRGRYANERVLVLYACDGHADVVGRAIVALRRLGRTIQTEEDLGDEVRWLAGSCEPCAEAAGRAPA